MIEHSLQGNITRSRFSVVESKGTDSVLNGMVLLTPHILSGVDV